MRVLPHERRYDSLERLDAALFAALGLVAVIARLDELLEKHGRPPASMGRRGARSPIARTPRTANAKDEGILMALVGIVALRRTCGAHLDALTADGHARRAGSAHTEARPTAPAPPSENSRRLLR